MNNKEDTLLPEYKSLEQSLDKLKEITGVDPRQFATNGDMSELMGTITGFMEQQGIDLSKIPVADGSILEQFGVQLPVETSQKNSEPERIIPRKMFNIYNRDLNNYLNELNQSFIQSLSVIGKLRLFLFEVDTLAQTEDLKLNMPTIDFSDDGDFPEATVSWYTSLDSTSCKLDITIKPDGQYASYIFSSPDNPTNKVINLDDIQNLLPIKQYIINLGIQEPTTEE